LMMIASAGSLASFYLLLSVVPLYVASTGADGIGAGLSTGVMMLSTVLAELAVSRLVARLGYRAVIAIGLILLGVPALALLHSSALPLVLVVCVARGAGLGILVVTGTALTAELVPVERRGEGLGLYGVVVGIPAIMGLPAGLWIVQHLGYGPVFISAAAVSLAVLPAVIGLPSNRSAGSGPPSTVTGIVAGAATGSASEHGGILGALRMGGLARPTMIFAAVTLAAGVIVTFLPLAVNTETLRLVPVAMLLQSLATPLARWWAGRFGDRHGSSPLLIPAVLATGAGTAALAWMNGPLPLIVGMGLFGIGFGIAQNVTLALMFERVPWERFGLVSALWNLAYDSGMGIGGVGFGLMIAFTGDIGYPVGFGLIAALVLATLSLAWLDRRTRRSAGESDRRH
jgi:MFS family permease